jgi:hypothetical protein
MTRNLTNTSDVPHFQETLLPVFTSTWQQIALLAPNLIKPIIIHHQNQKMIQEEGVLVVPKQTQNNR